MGINGRVKANSTKKIVFLEHSTQSATEPRQQEFLSFMCCPKATQLLIVPFAGF